MDSDSDEYQICEIEVKKMYIVVERKISLLLQEEMRQVGRLIIVLFYRIKNILCICLKDIPAKVSSNHLKIQVLLELVVWMLLKYVILNRCLLCYYWLD